MKEATFTIIGAGIAGLSTAIGLKRLGINAEIFEAAPEIKPVGAGLALAANAIKAFKKLGIAEDVIKEGNQLERFCIYTHKGRLTSATDTAALFEKHGISNFTIHRANLHKVLLSKLDQKNIHLGKRSTGVTQQADGFLIHFEDGSSHHTQYLIVADGINSPIRKQIVPESKIRYAGYTCWRGITENSNLSVTATSETWGPRGRFGIVPLANKQIYWFACVESTQNNTVYKNYSLQDIAKQFEGYHQPIEDIILQTAPHNLIWADICDLEPMKKYALKNLVFIGDAAHATTPNMGQGACQAIEDAAVLTDEIASNTKAEDAFTAFEQRRLPKTHWIVNQSWKLGKIAQNQNPLFRTVVDTLFKLAPQKLSEKQLEKIYAVDF